eukprot:6294503-Amphidinium_carterae.1
MNCAWRATRRNLVAVSTISSWPQWIIGQSGPAVSAGNVLLCGFSWILDSLRNVMMLLQLREQCASPS